MRRTIIAAAVIIAALQSSPATTARSSQPRQLTFEDRVRAQEAIERVYYAHQLGATKPFEQAVPRGVIEKKVRTYLRQSAALDELWDTPITGAMLRAEQNRIERSTRMPQRLSELYAALGHDSFLMQETLARATLADRMTRDFFAGDERFHLDAGRRESWDDWWPGVQHTFDDAGVEAVASSGTAPVSFALSAICGPSDVWDNGSLDDLPDPRPNATMVWTGTLVIIWGGGDYEDTNFYPPHSYNTGGRYDPLTDTWSSMSTVNAPSPRFAHTAVWTGTEMIVWGGYDDLRFEYFNTGGRYDPATDSWTTLPATGAPLARSHHTAVWTGSEMVVWGGLVEAAPNAAQTGGRYNPASDSWSPTSMTNAPAGRMEHHAVWTGSEMIVVGGLNENYFPLNSGGRYDPASDVWTATAVAPAGGDGTVVWTGTEMILWGGNSVNTGKRYRPATDSWTLTSTASAPSLWEPTAVWTGTEMIVYGECGQSVCAAGRYDPASNTWSSSTTVNTPSWRRSHAAVWTGSHMIVWGGYSTTANWRPVNTGARYDPVANSWTPTSTQGEPTPRWSSSALWTGSLLIIWSFGTGGRYDPLTDSWSAVSTQNAPLYDGFRNTAVWTGSRMIVFGGRYDPVADVWQPTSTVGAPSPRSDYSTVWTGSEFIVWGGRDDSGPGVNTGGRYNPVADAWTPTPTAGAPAGRRLHTAVWTGSEMIVWGGTTLASGARYNPATNIWTPLSTVDGPAARREHSAVWTGTEMIVWGGVTDVHPYYLNTGGRYNLAANTWTATSIALEARPGHTAVWTGTEMIVWNGLNYSSTQSEGGRYDPVTNLWTPVSTLLAPSLRLQHTAVWTGDSMFVWGGTDRFTNFSSGGRYKPGPEPDRDGDGRRSCDGDCDDTNAGVWGAPGEATDLTLRIDATTLDWTAPASTGATSISYDTLRSGTADEFVTGAVCVESGDGADTLALDGSTPSPGEFFFYLVRARNGCPGATGVGSVGTDSAGVPRGSRVCP